jgi:Tol biopolymer transport system component
MLTGRNLFAGETLSDTIALVLTRDCDLTALPPGTPIGVRRLLARALERDPKRRLRDIGDARVELDSTAPDVRDVVAERPPPPRWFVFQALRIGAAFAAGIALASAVFVAWPKASPSADAATAFKFLITPRDGVPFADEFAMNFVLSPDGRQMLMRGRIRGAFGWYVRSMVDGGVRQLDTLAPQGTPFWSPDSRSIGFLTGNSVSRMAADGTGVTTVTTLDRRSARGGSWSANGEIVFLLDAAIVAVPDRGGQPRVVLAPAASGPPFISTSALPDGKHVLVQQGGGGFSAGLTRVLLVTLDGSAGAKHLVDGVQPMYAAPGWLLAVKDGTRLVAWKMNLAQGRVEGDPVTVRESGSFARTGIGPRMFSVSQTGVLVVRPDDASDIVSTRLIWVDRAGAEGTSLKLDRHCRNPELSPTGDRVALECFQSSGGDRDIWLYDLARNAASRFTVDGADDADPLWSPDGRTIVFASNRLGTVDVFKKAAGGGAADELVLQTIGNTPTNAWSPDGQWIALLDLGGDLMVFDVAKRSAPRPVLASAFQEIELQFSPDGRWISYSSDESGRPEIYVQPWPANGERWQVSIDGGTDARWRPEGGELYYLSPTRSLMAVPVAVTPSFRAGTPVRLFEARIAGPLGNGHRFPYAVARDGKRFLLYVSDQDAAPPALDVIVNWPATLAAGRQP